MHRLIKGAAVAAFGISAVVPAAWLSAPAGASGAWTGGPVTIRVEIDLPSNSMSDGPLVQQVTGVTPGDQVELTSEDIIENPSNWCGSLLVDIIPETQTIEVSTGQYYVGEAVEPKAPSISGPDTTATTSVATPPLTSPVRGLQPGFGWDSCNFETATVTITGGGIDSITTVSDDLWDTGEDSGAIDAPMAAAPLPNTMQLVDVSALGGDARIAWVGDPIGETYDTNAPGLAVFRYTLASVAPTTVTPTTVTPTTVAPPVVAPATAVNANPTYTG